MSKVINWTQYFMGVAKLSAFRSKDPNTQVGACIVNEANKIVGVGYNGLPWGCEDNEFPWEVREGDLYETKYPYVVHAELNAILNSTGQLKGCRIYVSLFPCHRVCKGRLFKVVLVKLFMKMINIKGLTAIVRLKGC